MLSRKAKAQQVCHVCKQIRRVHRAVGSQGNRVAIVSHNSSNRLALGLDLCAIAAHYKQTPGSYSLSLSTMEWAKPCQIQRSQTWLFNHRALDSSFMACTQPATPELRKSKKASLKKAFSSTLLTKICAIEAFHQQHRRCPLLQTIQQQPQSPSQAGLSISKLVG